jgi:glucose/arabinose dehydrogenase
MNRALLLGFSFVLASCFGNALAQEPLSHSSESHALKTEYLVDRKDVIWGFDFLPDGRIIFTEKSGKMILHDPAKRTSVEVAGLPPIKVVGQGGLLDVRVHPDFKKNGLLYFAYVEGLEGGRHTTAVARAKLDGTKLTELKRLFSAFEPNENGIHFGTRIEFDGKGHVFFAIGDRDARPQVQSLGHHIGKLLRLNEDGSVPSDNPFVKREGAKPEIWSLGHRSPQGLAFRPGTSELWLAEMGPRGGDELNLIRAGANYGWPVITFGKEYSGFPVGKGITKKEGMEQPVTYWVPSISMSGMAFYTADAFPKWKGNLFLAGLGSMQIRRLVLNGQKVVHQESLLQKLGHRFRNVRQGPEGHLYFSTDDGKLGRIFP